MIECICIDEIPEKGWGRTIKNNKYFYSVASSNYYSIYQYTGKDINTDGNRIINYEYVYDIEVNIFSKYFMTIPELRNSKLNSILK